jgi:tetratricopeptide (TPR) repeat protein
MKRIILIGTCASVVSVACMCLAADPKRPNNQPAAPASPQPSPSGGGSRYFTPPNNGGNVTDAYRREGEARRAARAAAAEQASAAAAAARNAAAARAAAASAAANAQQNGSSQQSYSPNLPYGSGYYSPYGYWPYGYSPYGFIPPGTTPYILGYDPSTGAAFLYPYGGGYSSSYPSYGYQYPYYRNPYLGYGYPAAVFASADQFFGPGPVQQLMGGNPWFGQPQANGNGNFFANGNGNAANANPGAANNANGRPDAGAPGTPGPPARKPAPVGGGKAMEIAWKFITYGDTHFGKQKYIDALDRYRRAAHECPTLGDAWFREGFALAALGRYDQAAKAMRRGLEEKPDWVDNNFRLTELYGDGADEKKAVLDKMVKVAETQPTNADVAYVVGVHLYCDGKSDQAAPFLHRAAQILGTDADVKPFLAEER